MRKGWLALSVILAIIGTVFLIVAVILIPTSIQEATEYGLSFLVGTFLPAIVFYLLAYKSFGKAKQT